MRLVRQTQQSSTALTATFGLVLSAHSMCTVVMQQEGVEEDARVFAH